MNEQPIVSEDNIHCDPSCPYLFRLNPNDVYSLDARCTLTGEDLMWYDFWIAECEESKDVEGNKES